VKRSAVNIWTVSLSDRREAETVSAPAFQQSLISLVPTSGYLPDDRMEYAPIPSTALRAGLAGHPGPDLPAVPKRSDACPLCARKLRAAGQAAQQAIAYLGEPDPRLDLYRIFRLNLPPATRLQHDAPRPVLFRRRPPGCCRVRCSPGIGYGIQLPVSSTLVAKLSPRTASAC